MEIEINEKYEPLYTTDNDLIFIMGGRGSGKSFVIADWSCRTSYQVAEKILYTRWTLTSAEDSIIPEYKEKIELFDAENHFNIVSSKNPKIINLYTGSEILFKGLKSSSGNQTAQLKSIKNPTKWILDEAEELPDYNTFQKIRRSLRKKGAKIQTIMVMNALPTDHWIYKMFYVKKGIPQFFNGEKDGITYIHTDYFDNIDNLDETFLKDAEKTKKEEELEYRFEFLGECLDYNAKYLFRSNTLKRFRLSDLDNLDKNSVMQDVCYTDVAYEGDDHFCTPFGRVVNEYVYVHDVIFNEQGASDLDELLVEKMKLHNVQTYGIETIAGGSYFGDQIEEMYGKDYISIKSKSTKSKLTRIITERKNILKHFLFLHPDDIETDSEYDLFMQQLTSFHTKKKNEDDAPDATAGLANICRIDLGMFE